MTDMTKHSTQTDDRIARLALSLIDLRAHFEAQLRTVIRAEEALRKCRTANDDAAFNASVSALRGEVQIVSDNNRSVRTVIGHMDTDARELVVPDRK